MPRPRRRQRPSAEDLRDFGTAELRRHHMVVIEGDRESRMGGRAEPHAYVASQRLIDRYYLRRQLELRPSPLDEKAKRAWEYRNTVFRLAADNLLIDWTKAGKEPNVCADYSREIKHPVTNVGLDKLDASDRLARIWRAVGDPWAGLLEHSVCLDMLPGDWAIGQNLHPSRGMPALRVALGRLAEYYGFPLDPPAKS